MQATVLPAWSGRAGCGPSHTRCFRHGVHPPRVQPHRRDAQIRLLALSKEEEDEGWIELDPEMPWLQGEDGPLERRVSTTFEEGLLSDVVDEEAMRYWFSEPQDGWPTEKRRVKLLKQAREAEQRVSDSAWHEDAQGRTPLPGVVEGLAVTGTVTSQMRYLGVLVDFGAEYDGLIPLNDEATWDALGNRLRVGSCVEARVHRVRDARLFRYPVQLAPVDPALQALLPRPESHMGPMDLRDVRMDLETLARVSGRPYEAENYTFPTQSQLDEEEDGPDLGEEEEVEVLTWEEEDELDSIAAALST
ncbi:hypothetical protein ACKKBF_B03745 [Auxenochlorella protothecoides x Auxenochlorella symbiontica]